MPNKAEVDNNYLSYLETHPTLQHCRDPGPSRYPQKLTDTNI